jgi:hypothetical protein
MRVGQLMTVTMAGFLMTTGLAIAAPTFVSAGAPAAPTVFPADGATITAATPTVTATFPAPYRTDGSASLSVLDATSGTAMTCADVLRQVSGDEQLRCPLALLHDGDSYTATATAVDSATGQSQTMTWSFTADLPAVTAETTSPAPASTAPQISYDKPLDPSSTVELFGESETGRTIVDGTPTVAGHDATFTPAAPVTDGEYALVVHAVADGDTASYTDSVDEFFVGTPPTALGVAPTLTSVVTGTTSSEDPPLRPGFVALSGTGPSGAELSVQLYSPTSPPSRSTSQVFAIGVPSCPTSTCTWNRVAPAQTIAAAPTHAIRVFSTTGSVASTPDFLFQPNATGPAPATSVDLPPVTSANVHAVPVTVTLPVADVGAHLVVQGITDPSTRQSVPPFDLASVGGQINTTVDVSALEDGRISVFATPFDSYGNLGKTSVSAQSTKEAISLVPTGYTPSDTEVAAQPVVTVNFNETLQSDSTLTITTAAGKTVDGVSGPSGDSLTFSAINTPTQLANGSTVTLALHADASTCANNSTTPCDDQFSRTWTETVDTTPPPTPVKVSCSPGVVDPSSGLLTVAGESTSGDAVFVAAVGVKTHTQISRTIAPPPSTGRLTSWSTTLNLRAHAVGNYLVVAVDIDPAGNLGRESPVVYCGLGAPAALTLVGLPKSHIVPAVEKFAISGRLTSAGPSPKPLAGQIVKIRAFKGPHFDPGTDYVPLQTVRTDAAGVWHATVRLFHSEYLQAWFPGDTTFVPVSSWNGAPSRTTIRLPLSVDRPIARSISGHATPLLISGHERIRFDHGWASFNQPVSVVLRRAGDHRTIRAATRSSDGDWSLRLPVPRGHWTLTVTTAPKPDGHAPDFAPHQIRLKFRRR